VTLRPYRLLPLRPLHPHLSLRPLLVVVLPALRLCLRLPVVALLVRRHPVLRNLLLRREGRPFLWPLRRSRLLLLEVVELRPPHRPLVVEVLRPRL